MVETRSAWSRHNTWARRRRPLGAAATLAVLVFTTPAVMAAGGPGGGQPDLVVSVAANPAVVQPGAPFQWSVSVGNVGNGASGAFDVLLPPGAGANATGSGWSCVSVPTTRSGPARSLCHTAGLASGASSIITIAQNAPGTAASYSLTANVDTFNVVVESVETNNTATGSYVVPVNGPYDFVPRHTVSGADPTLPSETVTFSTSVDNIGLYPGFTTQTVTDTLPIGFAFVSWSATVVRWDPAIGPVSASPGSVSCTPTGSPPAGVVVTCTGVPNSSQSSTEGGSFSIVAQPAPTTALVDYLATDSVMVNSDHALVESNEANNTAIGTRRISNMLPDLAVTMSTSPNPVDAGGVITHTITITNTGMANAPFAQLQFGSLAGVWIGGGGNGAVCGVIFRTRSGPTMGCTVTDLAAGASVSFPLQLTAPGNVGTTTTTASVGVIGTRQAPIGADNSASTTATVAVAGLSDLTISAATAPIVASGQPVAIVVVVNNTGIGTAAPTTVTNTLPNGFAFVSGATGVGACTTAIQVVTCPIDATLPGRSQSWIINATAATAAGSLVDSSVVDPSNLVPESNETNNQSTLPITVSATLPDLMTSIDGPATVASNGKPTYAVTVANSGSAAADNTEFTVFVRGYDRIDAIAPPAGWTCTINRIKNGGNYVYCSSGGALTAGASATVQITAAGAYGKAAWPVTSTVDPANAVLELSETNNTATFTTTVN